MRGVGLVIKTWHLHNPKHAHKLGGQFKSQRHNLFSFFFFTLVTNLFTYGSAVLTCSYSFALFYSWCYHNHHYCPPAHTNFVLGRAEKSKKKKIIIISNEWHRTYTKWKLIYYSTSGQSKGTRIRETFSKSVLLTVHWQEKEICSSPLLLLSLSHEHLNLDKQKTEL